MPASLEFRQFLRDAADRHGAHEDFARKIGMTPSAFSRLISKGTHSLNELKCLRLAKLSAESPSVIFRLAGKPEAADLLDSLYQQRTSAAVTRKQREWLDVSDKLSTKQREYVLGVMQELTTHVPVRHTKRKTS